ncbi:MAG: DUF560 domain-containing protein [Pseudomonadales bacterium]|nr:DUF560 domain-containing protein [Pseudomonadales bacterium]
MHLVRLIQHVMVGVRRRWWWAMIWGLSAAGFCMDVYADQDPVLNKADQLLLGHQAKAAYEVLQPLEDERAGQLDYDYLLGLAALESGHSSEAAFAFERCLAEDPRNGPCRVQMARTHLALGEKGSARHELMIIRQSAPPPAVAQMVTTYLGDLDTVQKQHQRGVEGYVAMGSGYDTNANLATHDTQIAIPLFDNTLLPLSSAGQRQESGFVQSMAGISGHYRWGPAWTWLADADVADRDYLKHSTLNYRYDDMNLGGAYQHGVSQFSLKMQRQDYDLNNQIFRTLQGSMAQYQYSFSDTNEASAYLQESILHYPTDSSFNVDRRTLGAAWSAVASIPGAPVFFVGADAGHEYASSGGNSYNGDQFWGGRMGLTWFLSDVLAITSSYVAEHRHYDAQNPVFMTTRQDLQWDASFGVIYNLGHGFSVRPTYAYTNNSSNVVINRYSRAVSSLDLRYDM